MITDPRKFLLPVIAVLLVPCGCQREEDPPKVVMKVAQVLPETHPTNMAMHFFKQRAEELAHHRNHGLLPPEIAHCRTQLDLIRHLGLDVFSRNVYCNQSHCWFGGLAEEVWDGIEVCENVHLEGRDRVITRTYHTRGGTLTERQRHVFADSTLVQEKFVLDGVAYPPLGDVQLDEVMRMTSERFLITGGISAIETERFQSSDEVRRYVAALFERMRPYSHRFMLAASCNTSIRTPWRVILWFRDAWQEHNGSR